MSEDEIGDFDRPKRTRRILQVFGIGILAILLFMAGAYYGQNGPKSVPEPTSSSSDVMPARKPAQLCVGDAAEDTLIRSIYAAGMSRFQDGETDDVNYTATQIDEAIQYLRAEKFISVGRVTLGSVDANTDEIICNYEINYNTPEKYINYNSAFFAGILLGSQSEMPRNLFSHSAQPSTVSAAIVKDIKSGKQILQFVDGSEKPAAAVAGLLAASLIGHSKDGG